MRRACVGQLRRELAVAQRAVALLRHAHPRAEVDLVDRHRRVERVAPRARSPSTRASPHVVVEVPDDRRGRGRHLARGSRTGRPCRRGSRRGARRSGTCSASPCRRRGRSPPRCRTAPRRASGAGRSPQPSKSPMTWTRLGVGRPDGEVDAQHAGGVASRRATCAPKLRRRARAFLPRTGGRRRRRGGTFRAW